jgi:aminopeptidase-like protein
VSERPDKLRGRLAALDVDALGREMYALVEELYPIDRSLTGDGVRQTLARIAKEIPLQVHEVPSGTQVFDWTVPREWNVREAWIQGPDGAKVVDFRRSNLHLLGYSTPVQTRLSLAELRPHLFTLPEHPDWIPYRTSYYREAWGFCLPHRQLEALPEGEYEVKIDATLADGSLSYGECFLPGGEEREVLISCHVCHPSLANDNLSGIAVATLLARELKALPRRYSYRFLFAPGTIGAITWLARNEDTAHRIAHGLVAANLGDPGDFHYKKTRQGDAEIDRAVVQALGDLDHELTVEDFVPFGYDERQYASPGFNLAVGSLTRTPYGRYPQYHTSADDLTLVTPAALAGSLRAYLEVVALLEANRRYRNRNPKCEPQLGRRGLYRSIGGDDQGRQRELALLWVLNLSDRHHTLLDIAERARMPFAQIEEAAVALLAVDLLEPVEER